MKNVYLPLKYMKTIEQNINMSVKYETVLLQVYTLQRQ